MWLNESVRFFALLLAIPILLAVGGRVYPTRDALRGRPAGRHPNMREENHE